MQVDTTQRNQFEVLFFSMFRNRVNPKATYLCLPTNNCFSTCIKETLHCLELEIRGEVRSEHSSEFIANFYEFMLKDKVLKQYDYLLYSKILYTLKGYVEGNKTSKTDQYAFFEYLNKSALFKYRRKVSDRLIEFHEQNITDEIAYSYVDIFLNELLALGNNYLYISFLLNLYKEKRFSDFLHFLDYLVKGNSDSYDILIPISLLSDKDARLFELKDQKIEKISNATYCKVYSNNTADFFYIIKENMVRIESLFNILRFYNNSNVDFLYDQKILVTSKFFEDTFELSFNDIIKYRSKRYGKNYLHTTVQALEQLKNSHSHKTDYHKILNVISYAEKDKDILNASSYVDNWISLESLISLCGRKKGFEAVESIVPKMLSAKFFCDQVGMIAWKCGFGSDIESFIEKCENDTLNFDSIKNPFLRSRLVV